MDTQFGIERQAAATEHDRTRGVRWCEKRRSMFSSERVMTNILAGEIDAEWHFGS
jgi:hypothetical protein